MEVCKGTLHTWTILSENKRKENRSGIPRNRRRKIDDRCLVTILEIFTKGAHTDNRELTNIKRDTRATIHKQMTINVKV
jgi:hypothetical protein